ARATATYLPIPLPAPVTMAIFGDESINVLRYKQQSASQHSGASLLKSSNGLKWRSLGFCTGSLFEWASPTGGCLTVWSILDGNHLAKKSAFRTCGGLFGTIVIRRLASQSPCHFTSK